jgi:hypothetical protein
MSEPYRCTTRSCRKYRTLSKRKELYVTEPKCKVCGGNLSHRPRMREYDRERTCKCDGLPYPHKKGTTVWCTHHPTGPTEEDWRDRYYGDPIIET